MRSVAVLCALLIPACSSASPKAPPEPVDISGSWAGTSVASCAPFQTKPGRCRAENQIDFLILQDGSNIRGSYSCAYGNMTCLDGNESGQIVAATFFRSDSVTLRVQMPDGSSCLFSGTFDDAKVGGTYKCIEGGGIAENGNWHVKRPF